MIVLCLGTGKIATGQLVKPIVSQAALHAWDRPKDDASQGEDSPMFLPRRESPLEVSPFIFGKRSSSTNAFTVGHSRQSHVLIGLVSGIVIGASVGAIIGNNDAKRCHAESCQVSAALGGGADIVAGGLAGAVLGTIAGAVWPIR